MSVELEKRFNTVETLSLLLKYREVMFQLIRQIDNKTEQAIAKSEFYRIVVAHQQGLSRDERKTIGLVFDCSNLLQAKILNDIRATNGVTKLWFNTAIIDVFRLCEITLFRPLTSISLKASMAPLWSIQAEFDSKQLSVTPGTEEYKEWTAEIIHRVAELLGTIRANIAKLQRVGDVFEKEIVNEYSQFNHMELVREKYKQASRLYEREIKPLSIFLNQDTRYENGDGIYHILGRFFSAFDAIGDVDSASLMNAYQIQCLDLFEPIKIVAKHVNTFLQKTSAAISEHSAIEKAYNILRSAYEETLSGDQRNKFIKLENLKDLGLRHSIHSINRISPIRLERTQSFINIVFNELSLRTEAIRDEISDVFDEVVNRQNRTRLEYQENLEEWISNYQWPLNQDFILPVVQSLKNEIEGFSLPDIFIVIARVIKNTSLNVESQGTFNEIEDDDYSVRYKVRYITSFSESQRG